MTSTDHLIDPGFKVRTHRGKLRPFVSGVPLCLEAKKGRPGQAYFNLPDGTTLPSGQKRHRKVYLGRWEGDPRAMPASTAQKAMDIARRAENNGGVLPPEDRGTRDAPLTVLGLWKLFKDEAMRANNGEGRYTTAPYGKKSELRNLADSYRWLVALHGSEPVEGLTYEKLKSLRDTLGRGRRNAKNEPLPSPLHGTMFEGDDPIDHLNGEPFCGYSLNHARAVMRRIKWVLRWGWREGHVSAKVDEASRRVRSLDPGEAKCGNDPVEPVPEADIVAVLNGTKEIKGRGGKVLRTAPLLNRQQRAIILLCWTNAMRIGEACAIRPGDLSDEDGMLIYRPRHHKTKSRGKKRVIVLLGDSRKYLEPFLKRSADVLRGPDDPCFQPKEAYIEAMAAARAARETPLRPSESDSSELPEKEFPKKKFPEHFTPNGVGQAVRKACEHLGIPAWSPGQLRHNGATMIVRHSDEETARVALSHSTVSTTRIYAERDIARVRRIDGSIAEEMRRHVPNAAALVAG